jgi:eukaryotic-like serine/threonine-protein kinase
MTAERWRQIEELYHAALGCGPQARAALLARCDPEIKSEVESLLAQNSGEGILGQSALDAFAPSAVPRNPGDELGPYKIEGRIGAGGMGTVYRGYDTRLRRKVALKVLALENMPDVERKRRLLREARAASALNHPNIVTIYEIGSDRGVDFIAMEYVEGKRLDELVPSKGLAAAQILRYAVQIADALATAHAAGILHRDLKPSNIMVTGRERIKILDFGLAKAFEEPKRSPESSTLTMFPLTEEGTVTGTAPYMSPEQAQGLQLDGRSEVFSFGSVMYEMATGRRPFHADSRLALLNKIVNQDPQPPSELASVPPELEKVILRCLRKDVSRRYQTMADLKIALEDLETETSGRPANPSISPAISATRPLWLVHPRRAAALAAALLLMAGLGFLGIRTFHGSPNTDSLRTVKFTITPTNLRRGSDTDIDAEVSVSRDGKHIAYVEAQDAQLWIRDIDEEKARPVPGATNVYQVFWSPDNQFIGYARGCVNAGCDLVRIPVEGGTPTIIAKTKGLFRRANWSSDGETVVYCDTTGMYTVPTKGGPTTLVLAHPHIEHPSFLDLPHNRRAFLYQAVDAGMRGHGLFVQVEGEQQRHLLLVSSSTNPYPAYSPTGHIVYVDGFRDASAIWALPFSLEKLEATGKPFPITQHGSSPSLSLTGTLVYSDLPTDRQQLGTVDRSGGNFTPIGDAQRQSSPRLSPDGRKLAIEMVDTDPDLYIYDLTRAVKTRFTFDSAGVRLAGWTPSGDEIVYASNRNGNLDIFSKASSGNSDAKLLVARAAGPDWSPDQRFLIYVANSPETKGDLIYRERQKDGSLGDAKVFLKTPFNEVSPRFSPEGRFVAYVSDESGHNEVYVRDFPAGANKWQISAMGGTEPAWKKDGKELFYVEGRKLMAVSIATRPAFSSGTPAGLFEKRSLQSSLNPQYDVSADGKLFYILDRPAGEKPLSIHVVHNWFEEFRGQQAR